MIQFKADYCIYVCIGQILKAKHDINRYINNFQGCVENQT